LLTSFFRYLYGYVRIRLTGYSPERFLNLCKTHHIEIWDLQNEGAYYEMNLSIRDFRRLKPLRRKTKAHLLVTERHGLPFFLHHYRNRKMFVVGIALCIAFLYIMSLFIWNIHIEGNYSRTTNVILDYLESEHIVHGMRKDKVDCKEIQSMIRIQFPDIIWVSAEIKGTRLLIRIRENMDSIPIEEEAGSEEPRDITAAREGIITSVLVRSGVSQIQVGDEVEQGQLLVLGRIDILNDSGDVSGYQYTAADADVYARTTYTYYDEFVLSHEERHPTGKKRYGIYAKVGGKTISVDLRPKFERFSALNTEYPLKLTENFYLPLTFGTTCYEEYEIYTESYSEEEARALAEANLHEFLENLIQKGVQIIENNVKIEVGTNTCIAVGTITAVEEIGSSVPAEILDEPAMPSDEDEK
jgi:similar to stage IV sporulation protein